jgi:hypothetical protein
MTASAQVRLDLVLRGSESITKTVEQARNQIGKAAESVATFAQKQDEALDKGQGAWAKLQGAVGGIQTKLSALGPAMSIFNQGVAFVNEWRESMQAAEEDLRALSSYSQTFGGDLRSLDKLAEDAGFALDKMKLTRMANQAALFGISLEQVGLGLRVASDIGDRTGESFDTLWRAIINTASGASESSDRFNKLTGATLDLKRETERYAASLGKTADQLTETERRAAAATATFGYLAENMDPGINYEQAQGWHRLNRAVENFGSNIGHATAQITGVLVNQGFNLWDAVLGTTVERIAGLDAKVVRSATSFRDLAGMMGVSKSGAQLMNWELVKLSNTLDGSVMGMFAVATAAGEMAAGLKRVETASKKANDAWADAAGDLKKEWDGALKKIKEADDYFQEENRKAFEKAAQEREARGKAAAAKAKAERERQAQQERQEAERNAQYGLDQFMRGQEALTRLRVENWEAEKQRQREAEEEQRRMMEEALQREIDLENQRRANLEATVMGLQAMDAQLGAIRGSLTRTMRGTATIMRGITLHMDGVIKGQAGSISALGAITASVFENQRAQAGVMALAASGEGFYALARHDYPAAANAFTSAAIFGMVAGGAGGAGGGASGGGGGGGMGGAGMSSPSLATAGPAQGGNTVVYVSGFVGSPLQLATALAGTQDRSREANLVRPRGV